MARLAFVAQARETAEMIRIAHSVFALPFALASAALALRVEGGWSWSKVFWIVFCAVCARTAAMAQNRLLDARLDALNPRTAHRALPAGRVTRGFVLGLILAASALFVLGAWQLNRLCFYLSPVALAVLLAYPLSKRFTTLCHLWLGVSLGLAPVGAWLAVRGAFVDMATPLLLGAAVTLWTAGLDLIYACQDAAHDRHQGLFSVPARVGVAGALRLSVGLHALCMLFFVAVVRVNPHVRWLYGAGLVAAVALLIYEHAIVRPHDLSRVDVAFFTMNGLVSLIVGAVTVADALL
ncbi:MAG: UbiA-like polyprenyltransferase [Planctomycetota bacterium]